MGIRLTSHNVEREHLLEAERRVLDALNELCRLYIHLNYPLLAEMVGKLSADLLRIGVLWWQQNKKRED